MPKGKMQKKEMKRKEKEKRRQQIEAERAAVKKSLLQTKQVASVAKPGKRERQEARRQLQSDAEEKEQRKGRGAGKPGNGDSSRVAKNRAVREQDRDERTRLKTQKSPKNGDNSAADPSLEYLDNPLDCPMVDRAKEFFNGKSANNKPRLKKKFPVYCGQREHWRSVAKLSVRVRKDNHKQSSSNCPEKSGGKKSTKPKSRCEIGIYLPGSTELLDLSRGRGSPVHHQLIDKAVSRIAKAVEDARVKDTTTHILELEEKQKKTRAKQGEAAGQDGQGKYGKKGLGSAGRDKSASVDPFARMRSDTLRSVMVAVDKESNRAQVTLIWNNDEFPAGLTGGGGSGSSKSFEKRVSESSAASDSSHPLKKLVSRLLESSCSKLLHSVWIHSNTLSKHDNSIVDFSGKWECVWSWTDGEKKSIGEKSEAGKEGAIQAETPLDSARNGAVEYLFSSKTDIPRIPLQFPPNVFRQANGKSFGRIVMQIRDYIARLAGKKQSPSQSQTTSSTTSSDFSVLELYGGVGTIGLHLVEIPELMYLHCSDSNPYNTGAFTRALERYGQSAEEMGAQSGKNQNEKQQAEIITPTHNPFAAGSSSSSSTVRNCRSLGLFRPNRGDANIFAESLPDTDEYTAIRKLLRNESSAGSSSSSSSTARNLRWILNRRALTEASRLSETPSKSESSTTAESQKGSDGSPPAASSSSSSSSSSTNPKTTEKLSQSRPLLLQYTPLSASDMIKRNAHLGRDLVIVDPPRKGLDAEVLEGLCMQAGAASEAGEGERLSNRDADMCEGDSVERKVPKHLVYVSCGFKAFMRDHEKLTADGGWELERAEGFVLFPGSDHIETLAFYSRK